jgi:hypothetical protein
MEPSNQDVVHALRDVQSRVNDALTLLGVSKTSSQKKLSVTVLDATLDQVTYKRKFLVRIDLDGVECDVTCREKGTSVILVDC